MKLAEIQTINEITPIEGADRIELAKVQGWQSVVVRGTYSVGDRIVFIPIDTVLRPETWNSFLHDKKDPTTHIRVKSVKLKGVYSQGLIFPLTILPDPFFGYEVGADVADLIGVTKYEKPIPAHLTGQVKGDFPTHLVSKTDEDNLKSNIEVLDELKEADFVEATIKIDGTSATYIKELDGTFRVCSRNLELKDTESNVHWQMARKYNIQETLKSGYCIQGEIFGAGIQKNPSGQREIDFRIFNIIDLSTRLPISPRFHYKSDIFNPEIRIVDVATFWFKEEFKSMTIDSLQEFANECKYSNGTPAEGIVLRGFKDSSCKDTMYSKKLQKMLSIKIINQNYKD
jgi:RNA ligase (TIGR02306 family)